MAEQKTGGAAPETGPARVEVDVQRPAITQVEPGGGATTSTSSEGTHVDFGAGLGPEADAEDTLEGGQGADTIEGGEGPDKQEGPEEGALPEYDGANEEVRKQYDEKYFTAEGTVNLPTLSQEFFANLEKGEGKLNDGTYAYLQDSLGLDKAAVQEIERGQMALREQAQTQFYGRIDGGKEAYEAAIKWGVEGGYTPAQREAYNKAQAQGGPAFEDAVDALMARFAKATGKGGQQGGRRGPPGKRQSTPQRDVTGGSRSNADAPAGERFASREEHSVAWSKALDDVAKARRTGDRQEIRKAEEAREAIRRKAARGFRS